LDLSYPSSNEILGQASLTDKTIEELHIAIRALSDQDVQIWPAIMQVLTLTRQLEISQSFKRFASDQYTLQLQRISEDNEALRLELQQLLGKLAARSITRACRTGQLVSHATDFESYQGSNDPFDPDLEP